MNKSVTASAIRSTKSPPATKFIVVLRVLLGAMSMAGLLGWSYLTLFVLGLGGRAILVHPIMFFYLFGYVYLLLSLYPCFKKPSIKTLFIMGLVLNVFPAVLFIYWVLNVVDYLTPGAFVPLAYILVWTLLWIALVCRSQHLGSKSGRDNEPGGRHVTVRRGYGLATYD